MTRGSSFVHQVAVYDSDQDLVETLVPYLHRGLAAGEPTLVNVGQREREILVDALDDTSGITFLQAGIYSHPLMSLKDVRALVADQASAGRARLVGQIPLADIEADWYGWRRYEAAVNHVLAEFAAQTICLYDARGIPDGVLADVNRIHPRLATVGGASEANDAHVETGELLSDFLRGTPDPLEDAEPKISLASPRVDVARNAVAAVARGTRLGPDKVHALTLSVSEIVTNAYLHGTPPVTVHAWTAPRRVVVTVTDRGAGPRSPFAVLGPAAGEPTSSGFGLWIAHQMCSRVDHIRDSDGFTVRLTMTAAGDG